MIGWGPRTALMLAAGLATSCAEESPGAPRGQAPGENPNVVLVSIDSLRADHLGCYGYGPATSPFIDELAARGVLFENALSTSSWTLPAHAALFTGLRDSVHGLFDNGRRLPESRLTLAELLARRGYRTAGFFGGPYLHPAFGVGQGFDDYVDCMSARGADEAAVRASARSPRGPSHEDVTGPRTRAAIRRWAAADSSGPFFLFVHLWDVHYDFRAPAEFVEMFDPDYRGTVDGRLMSNPAIHPDMDQRDLEHVLALYDAEIRFTDEILRSIFDHLGRRGMLEDTVVIITSDHGEEFFEHGQKGHNKTLFDEVLRVPLIVVWPDHFDPGRLVSTQVQLIDLMPTIARLSGHEGPLGVQGRDLGPLLRGGELPEQDALAELLIDGLQVRALRNSERKVLEQTRSQPAVLFDLKLDPGEQRVIRRGDPDHEERLTRAAGELADAIDRSFQFRAALLVDENENAGLELTEELEDRLRSLGYLGQDAD